MIVDLFIGFWTYVYMLFLGVVAVAVVAQLLR